VDIDRYIATNQTAWTRLAELTQQASRGLGRMSAADLDELVRLYQRVSTHLSYARTTYRDPALTARLSGLVARAAAVVYGTRPRTLRTVGWFFTTTFPAALWHIRWHVAAAFGIFTLPFLAVAVWLASSPAALEVAMPEAALQAYVEEEFEEYYASEYASEFASSVFTKNVQVGFTAFALGIFGCVGTAYVLLLNGIGLGQAAGVFAAVGQQPKFWGLILPHGALELTAVFIAGGAGLALGWALISPGDRPRTTALVEMGRRSIVIVFGLILVFAVAGFIEGFVTGQPWPTWLRVGIGLTSWALFMVYAVVCGRAATRRGFTGRLDEQETTRFVPQARPEPQPQRA
jgi:uncharacterized membrane protein SpoIIM required for sporulation